MKIKIISKKLIDVFIDLENQQTGFEPEAWLRLQKREQNWVQIAGIKLPKWKYKMITEELKKGNY